MMHVLKRLAELDRNVLLVGTHGVGKTAMVKQLADDLGEQFLYLSGALLDPIVDMKGVPVPDKERRLLDYYRDESFAQCEFLFIDELNRAHPRVLNAILEIVQFRSLNGRRLPHLKRIWGAINPPNGDYEVEELDPALADRFHAHVVVESAFPLTYLSERYDPAHVELVHQWWSGDLNTKQRVVATPRRCEYILQFMAADIAPVSWMAPAGKEILIPALRKRWDAYVSRSSRRPLTIDDILSGQFDAGDPAQCIEAVRLVKSVSSFIDGRDTVELLRNLPTEHRRAVISLLDEDRRKQLVAALDLGRQTDREISDMLQTTQVRTPVVLGIWVDNDPNSPNYNPAWDHDPWKDCE